MIIEIILFVVFVLLFFFGFYIIHRQIALVKRGEFKVKDRLQCIIYGILFSLATMIVISMGATFTIETVNPLFLLIPFIICLSYMTIYPLIDFLFIALSRESDEGLTPFHKFISKNIINRSKNKKVSFFMAVLLYSLFITPILLLTLAGLPFLLIWISSMLIYPLLNLILYGTKGYIAGISNEYYHIPEIKRSIFLNFEDSKRGMKQFISSPRPYIILGFMIFVFLWAWISLFQTMGFFFTGSFAISTMSSYFAYVTLFFGIIGYFTRFWGRKIKYRAIDIYFAAYLMAAIGINVFINFILVNINVLSSSLNFWILTQEIELKYILYSWPSAIEEIILIIFTSYYLISKKNEFKFNIKYSKITQCGQTFDPIPLFNFIKNPNPELRVHAENTILLMFERIPLKSEVNPNEWKFKDMLIDGLCDPNLNSRRTCYKILKQLENTIPESILPWIIDGLQAPNYDKVYPFARSLLDADMDLLQKVPKKLILNLINDSEWRLKVVGLKLISKLIKHDKQMYLSLNIEKLINNPNNQIKIEAFKIIEMYGFSVPINDILSKLNHPNRKVRAAAIRSLKNVSIERINSKLVSQIIPYMADPTGTVRSSVFEAFAKIGNFKKFSIPVEPIFDGLADSDEVVRRSAVMALKTYFNENPKTLNIDTIVNRIDPTNTNILKSVLNLLGDLWEKDPEKILTIFLIFIKFEDDELKKEISRVLIKKYPISPNLIFDNLIKIKDESKFITKGIISSTIIEFARSNPDITFPKLLRSFESDNDDVVLNSIASFEGLIEDHLDKMQLETILSIFKKTHDIKIRKEGSQLISSIAKINPLFLKPVINELLQLQKSLDTSVRIILTKAILEIVKNEPELIPVPNIVDFLSDNDAFVREIAVKALGFLGHTRPLEIIDILLNKALLDDEWIVREAAVSSLAILISEVDDKREILLKLVSLMGDNNVWVRNSAMNLIASIEDVTPSIIPFDKLSDNLIHSNPKVRQAAANLLKIYDFNIINDNFDKITILLGDESEEVRRSIINTMTEVINNVGLSKMLSRLLKNLSDSGSLTTQQSIARILGRTAKYEEEMIKKRVIALLKVRCEMSQDPIICEVLTKLKEN
ncbi:MAG: HEAT repeat domain-containing protein [Promethearchaeota archaeon]